MRRCDVRKGAQVLLFLNNGMRQNLSHNSVRIGQRLQIAEDSRKFLSDARTQVYTFYVVRGFFGVVSLQCTLNC